jgi:hypothetical protein
VRTFLGLLGSAVLAAAIAWGVRSLGFYTPGVGQSFQAWTIGCWLLFAASFLLLRRVPAESAVAVVLIGAGLIGAAALSGPPNTSTDSARYAWDGILQNEGVSPYAHAPNSHATAGYRTDWLFPAPVTTASGREVCQGTRVMTTHDTATHDVLCTTINRATVFTIYPAAAELYFAAVRALVPTTAAYWPLQASGLLVSLAITAGLVAILRRRGLDPRWAALWGWCPLVASEAVTNSHVDVIAAGTLLLATALVATSRRVLGGIALGVSIAVKLMPVVGAPALARRRPWTVALAAVATFAVVYVPYVVATGPKVLGFLPGYLKEEGVDDGSRFALVFLFVHGQATTVAAILLLAVVALVVWRTTDPASPWLGQLVMIGAFLFVLSPRYPWYGLLLIPFVAMTGRWEWLALALAISIRQFWPFAYVRASTLGMALAFIVVMAVVRSGPGRRRRIRERAVAEWELLSRRPRARG